MGSRVLRLGTSSSAPHAGDLAFLGDISKNKETLVNKNGQGFLFSNLFNRRTNGHYVVPSSWFWTSGAPSWAIICFSSQCVVIIVPCKPPLLVFLCYFILVSSLPFPPIPTSTSAGTDSNGFYVCPQIHVCLRACGIFFVCAHPAERLPG